MMNNKKSHAAQLENQLLMRHLEQFDGQRLLILGHCEEFAEFFFDCKSIHVHSSQFHFYEELQTLLSADSGQTSSFGILPPKTAFEHRDKVIYYWSKSKQQSLFQLLFIMANLPEQVDLFVVGENRSGINSLKALVKEFADVNKLDSARHSSLYYVAIHKKTVFKLNDWWHCFQINEGDLGLAKAVQIEALPGVFSQKQLDEGTKLLLQTIFSEQYLCSGSLTAISSVLDLGCGSGIIAKTILQQRSDMKLLATDVDAFALESTKRNLAAFANAEVRASDVFSEITESFDLILSNPPFHQGQKTDYSAVEKLILQAKHHLNPNGKFYLVANHFLPYEELILKQFKTVLKCAETTKFKVYQLSY